MSLRLMKLQIISNRNCHFNQTGCGMKIRVDDPLAMKNFIQSVQNRVNELKASCGDNQDNTNSKRVSYTSLL